MRRVWAFVILLLAALVFGAWASDFITMQGERTVYTVECRGGTWQDDHCSGNVVAGNRYRYRALKPHNEVIFWKVGVERPLRQVRRLRHPGRPQLGLQAGQRRGALDHAGDVGGRTGARTSRRDAAVSRRLEVALAAPRTAASRATSRCR